MKASPTVVLIRHGESEWNAAGRFTGSSDIDLSTTGRIQARVAGQQLVRADLRPTAVHTSTLRRAIETTDLLLDAAGAKDVSISKDPRLNERCYGALEGRRKSEVRAEYGDMSFDLWRRSFSVPPPSSEGRVGESLSDVLERVLPYWMTAIAPDLGLGGCVLVVAHGSSLRALIKHLDGLSHDEVAALNVPTGMPLVYELDPQLRPLTPSGRYLAPRAAARAARDVASQGREEPP